MSPMNPLKQQELFEEFVIREKRKGRFLGAFRFKKPLFPQHKLNISVSHEALIIGLIGLVLIISVIFSLGVERGRNLELAQGSYKDIQPSAETKVKGPQIQPTGKPIGAEVQKQPETKPTEQETEKVVPVPAEERPFTIQVASFKTRTLAEKELEHLKNIGYSSDVLKKGSFFVVWVGTYEKKELAQQTLKDLTRIYKDCYVRRR